MCSFFIHSHNHESASLNTQSCRGCKKWEQTAALKVPLLSSSGLHFPNQGNINLASLALSNLELKQWKSGANESNVGGEEAPRWAESPRQSVFAKPDTVSRLYRQLLSVCLHKFFSDVCDWNKTAEVHMSKFMPDIKNFWVLNFVYFGFSPSWWTCAVWWVWMVLLSAALP